MGGMAVRLSPLVWGDLNERGGVGGVLPAPVSWVGVPASCVAGAGVVRCPRRRLPGGGRARYLPVRSRGQRLAAAGPRPRNGEITMPSAPQILPTQIPEGVAPGVKYRLEGELVPVLHMALDGQVPVYFEHHVLLWKYPSLQIGLHPLRKGLKRRAFGGMPLLLLEAQSAGEIAFSRDAPGHIVALHLPAGTGVIV